jgi:hypothetical protein
MLAFPAAAVSIASLPGEALGNVPSPPQACRPKSCAEKADATCAGLRFGVDALDHDAVVKRTEFHAIKGFDDVGCWLSADMIVAR